MGPGDQRETELAICKANAFSTLLNFHPLAIDIYPLLVYFVYVRGDPMDTFFNKSSQMIFP